MSIFSERLTTLREASGLSKTKMANKVGVPLSTYANWEYGYNDPDMDRLKKVATILETTVDYLIGKVDNPSFGPSSFTNEDLDKMVDNARSFDGKKMTDHDRSVIKNLLKGYFTAK